jgi:hypothetical protein
MSRAAPGERGVTSNSWWVEYLPSWPPFPPCGGQVMSCGRSRGVTLGTASSVRVAAGARRRPSPSVVARRHRPARGLWAPTPLPGSTWHPRTRVVGCPLGGNRYARMRGRGDARSGCATANGSGRTTVQPTSRLPHLMFFQPRLPGNTGSTVGLAAVTGTRLHLIEPLGFDLDEPKLRRAGLDYHDLATVEVHPSLDGAGRAAGRPGVRVGHPGDNALYRGGPSAG